MAKHAHCACSTAQAKKGQAQPDTPNTHQVIQRIAASLAPRLLALLVCLPQELVFQPAAAAPSGAPQSCQKPQQSPIFIETPTTQMARSCARQPAPRRRKEACGLCGGMVAPPAAQEGCKSSNSIQGQHPPFAPYLDPPLVGREEKGGGHT